MSDFNPRIPTEEAAERAREFAARVADEVVDSPSWYTSGGVETITKIERVVDGLPAVQAYALGQVLRYFDRAGRKDATDTDLGKANNYAHRLVYGGWRDSDE